MSENQYGRVDQFDQFDHEADDEFINNNTEGAPDNAASNEQSLFNLTQSAVGAPEGTLDDAPSSPPESQALTPTPSNDAVEPFNVFGTIGSEATPNPNSMDMDRSITTLETAPVFSGQPIDLLDTSTRTAPPATMATFDPMNTAPTPTTTEATAFDPIISSTPSQKAPFPEASPLPSSSTTMDPTQYERQEDHELEFFEDDGYSNNDSSRDESRNFVRNFLTGNDDEDHLVEQKDLIGSHTITGYTDRIEMGAIDRTSLSADMPRGRNSFARTTAMEKYDIDLKHYEQVRNQRKSKRNKLIGIAALLFTIVIAIVVGSTAGGNDSNAAPSANNRPSSNSTASNTPIIPASNVTGGGVNGTNATLPPGVTNATVPPGDATSFNDNDGGGLQNIGGQDPVGAGSGGDTGTNDSGSGGGNQGVTPAPTLAPVAPVTPTGGSGGGGGTPTTSGGGGSGAPAPTMVPITAAEQVRLDSVIVAAEQFVQETIDWDAEDTPIALKKTLSWLANGDTAGIDISDPKFPQRLALTAIYFATNPCGESPCGDRWVSYGNWVSGESHCNWFGVSCDLNENVVELDLSNNGLKGHLPSELVLLTALTKLNLNTNNVFAAIPTTVGQLSALEILDLGNNIMVGGIPSEAYQATQLRELYLNNNMLTGSLSANLAQLTKLEQLNLQNNQFRGTVPDAFGPLTNLIKVQLEGNQFTGDVPSL